MQYFFCVVSFILFSLSLFTLFFLSILHSFYIYIFQFLPGGDTSLQLSIMNCLGVCISEDDHTLLSRVHIFYTLEELIESALALNIEEGQSAANTTSFSTSSTSVQNNPPMQPNPSNSIASSFSTSSVIPSNSARSLQIVIRAAMKLFIFLSLQVATSGEREMSYVASKFSTISLKRARSGKGKCCERR